MTHGVRFSFLPSMSPSSLRVKTAGREFNADCSIDLATDSAIFTRSDEGDFVLRRSPRSCLWNAPEPTRKAGVFRRLHTPYVEQR